MYESEFTRGREWLNYDIEFYTDGFLETENFREEMCKNCGFESDYCDLFDVECVRHCEVVQCIEIAKTASKAIKSITRGSWAEVKIC